MRCGNTWPKVRSANRKDFDKTLEGMAASEDPLFFAIIDRIRACRRPRFLPEESILSMARLK